MSYRRLRGDVIEVYKILTGKYDPEVCKNFIQLRGDGGTRPPGRGNPLKIYKLRPNLDVKKKGFPHRIVDIWNNLPASVVDAKTLLTFESRLDKFWESQEIKFDYKAKFNFKNGSARHDISNDLESEASQEA